MGIKWGASIAVFIWSNSMGVERGASIAVFIWSNSNGIKYIHFGLFEFAYYRADWSFIRVERLIVHEFFQLDF